MKYGQYQFLEGPGVGLVVLFLGKLTMYRSFPVPLIWHNWRIMTDILVNLTSNVKRKIIGKEK